MSGIKSRKGFFSASGPGLLVLLMVILSTNAFAANCTSASTTFYASGAFDDGDTLGGTVIIDTGCGSLVTAALTIGTATGTLDFDGVSSIQGNQPALGFYFADFDSDGFTLDLDIYSTGLRGYTGGALCADVMPAGESCSSGTVETNYMSDADPVLHAGMLSTSAAPEPSSVVLLLGGMTAVIPLIRRKFRA